MEMVVMKHIVQSLVRTVRDNDDELDNNQLVNQHPMVKKQFLHHQLTM
jgi:hypothetical protein